MACHNLFWKESKAESTFQVPDLAVSAGPGPVDIVLKLGEDVKRTRQCRSRYCMRFTPVEDICEATLEAMTEAASSIVAPHFPDKDASTSTTTFAVHYEHRASVNLDRLKIINAVLTSVKQVESFVPGFCFPLHVCALCINWFLSGLIPGCQSGNIESEGPDLPGLSSIQVSSQLCLRGGPPGLRVGDMHFHDSLCLCSPPTRQT